MKLVQITDSGYTFEFELEGEEAITIKVTGERKEAMRKLKKAFGPDVKIVTFDDMDD